MKKRIARLSVRLPVPLAEPVGLGDVVKRVTSAAGIPACGGCQRRAEALNRALTFTGAAPSKRKDSV